MATLSRFLIFDTTPISVSVKYLKNFSSDCGRNGGFMSGENAYQVLGLKETCTPAEIKASFRTLAKETHPDMAAAAQADSQEASRRFVRIMAAYEILSDSHRRAHYDEYLLSQRNIVLKHPKRRSGLYRYDSFAVSARQLEVVEWLKWYRLTINDIVSKKKLASGSGYINVLESEFYAAINAAYYGPRMDSMDCLPDCFEAEERSSFETPDILHLVSGRDLFGFVRLADNDLNISDFFSEKLPTFSCKHGSLISSLSTTDLHFSSNIVKNYDDGYVSDICKDLVLHISGEVVAYATRIPPKSIRNGISNEEDQDHIHVFLNMNDDSLSSRGPFSDKAEGSRALLGTISGLQTSGEEGSCDVYDNCGVKTHVVMKHRTLMVKHLHWYQSGHRNSPCECRCSRARLPPSKFWLFEPRCCLHDVGGWYIETFGRDQKGKTVPSQRSWDGFEASKRLDRRLHPAMYLLALAYRTLDIEDSRRRKQTIVDVIRPKWLNILRWCKKIV